MRRPKTDNARQQLRVRRFESVVGPRSVIARPVDRCLEAIADAVRWMSSLPPGELMGDDAVGWWLLLEHNSRPSSAAIEAIRKQLASLLPKIEPGRSVTYTATALARTLARSGQLTDGLLIQQAFLSALDAAIAKSRKKGPRAPLVIDVIWLIQAIYEMGGDMKTPTNFQPMLDVALRADLWSRLMILPFLSEALGRPLWKRLEAALRGEIKAATTTLAKVDKLHWEVSYLLSACVRLKMGETAHQIADFLIARQSDGEWDADSDENIESTALVALSLAEFWRSYGETRTYYDQQLPALAVADRLNLQDFLKVAWQKVLRASKGDRGKALEQFIAKYCRDDDNFRVEHCNYRTESEELDLVLINDGRREFFRQLESSRVIVECKCRSDKTTAADVRNFCAKVRNRPRILTKVGVLISVAGFTRDVTIEIVRMNSRDDPLIGLITGEELTGGLAEDANFSTLVEKALSFSSLQ